MKRESEVEKIEDEIVKEEHIVFHFLRRGLISLIIIFTFLMVGSGFFIVVEKMSPIDAVYHSAMIMTGMGPVQDIVTPAAKIFSAFYAILSIGIVVGSIFYIFEPLYNRWHRRTYVEFHRKLKYNRR